MPLTPGRWALPVLASLVHDVRWTARQADAAAHAAAPASSRRTHAHLEAAARVLNKAFSACLADRHPVLHESKKWGTYAMVGALFRTYFELQSVALCKNVVRALGAGELPPLDAFPRAQTVTFRYFMGRLAFLDEDYVCADAELSRAWADAPRAASAQLEYVAALTL